MITAKLKDVSQRLHTPINKTMFVKKQTRVLIVDDSAIARAVLGELIDRESDFLVAGYAADALCAMQIIKQGGIDVVTLDIEMPQINGLELLKQIMATTPLPVLMVAGSNARQASRTLQALADGAVHFIEKHQGSVQSFDGFAKRFLAALRATSQVKPAFIRDPVSSSDAAKKAAPLTIQKTSRLANQSTNVPTNFLTLQGKTPVTHLQSKLDFQIIAIGASTGGTEAIRKLLAQLPPDCPPVVVCIHMPASFTASYASRLDTQFEQTVQLMQNRHVLQRGCVYIVPGNQQASILQLRSGHFITSLQDALDSDIYKPSIDYLFSSIAKLQTVQCAAFVLTGMGKDGTIGAAALKKKAIKTGTKIWGQSEETCVVYGMPKSALEAGVLDAILPIQTITAGLFTEP